MEMEKLKNPFLFYFFVTIFLVFFITVMIIVVSCASVHKHDQESDLLYNNDEDSEMSLDHDLLMKY